MHAKLDLLEKQVGNWTVVERRKIVKGLQRWNCRCQCGYEREFSTSYLNTGKPACCPDCRKNLQGETDGELRARYLGKTVGKYTVLEMVGRNRYGSRVWLCRCVCGQERKFLTASLSGNGKRQATQCPGCALQQMEDANRVVLEIPLRFWARLIQHAERRGHKVLITKEEAQALFQKQKGTCALTAEPLCFTKLRTNFNRYTTASLDRIDSKLPYQKGNVQWVHKTLNMMKGSLSQELFLQWCRKVASEHASEKEM